jgi:hypothetical protein
MSQIVTSTEFNRLSAQVKALTDREHGHLDRLDRLGERVAKLELRLGQAAKYAVPPELPNPAELFEDSEQAGPSASDGDFLDP